MDVLQPVATPPQRHPDLQGLWTNTALTFLQRPPIFKGLIATEALIGAGVRRVVGAATDPDPRVAGRGYAMLRAAGFTVEAHPESDVYLCRVAPVPYAKYGPAAVYPAKGETR